MKLILALSIVYLAIAGSCTNQKQKVDESSSVSKEDSILLTEIKAMPDPKPRQIRLFNDVTELRESLSRVGIGPMRKWWSDGAGWMSASNFYEIGSPGPSGMPGNLAFYLESPSENYVESLKVKVNINNMAEKRQALNKYTDIVMKTFQVLGLSAPSGLKSALLSGKVYEHNDRQRQIKNIFEPGNIDSWKLQIISH